MITLRSAFPVRISYSVKVRSDPTLASTDASDRLNLTEVIVSVEVGNVRFEIGAVLPYPTRSKKKMTDMGCADTSGVPYFDSSHIWTILEAVAKTGSVRWWSIELSKQNNGGCLISVTFPTDGRKRPRT